MTDLQLFLAIGVPVLFNAAAPGIWRNAETAFDVPGRKRSTPARAPLPLDWKQPPALPE
jgi:hypothetical protein